MEGWTQFPFDAATEIRSVGAKIKGLAEGRTGDKRQAHAHLLRLQGLLCFQETGVVSRSCICLCFHHAGHRRPCLQQGDTPCKEGSA